ncbi:RHS repeat-associated core domain-containing protein, partial [Citrobacter portucalensis]|uniref:RHS repeat-associated core domain-containing protein n=1 Tax=Citrobacter portucalensis TaxID=1639133 RepID=UPI00226BA513
LQWRYRWDARSQLTGLETPEGERWEYKYDPFGRRISKRCTNRNKPGMDFHWNGDQLTEEIPVNADGTPDDENAIRWIYEPGSFTPLARYEKGQLHYAVTDTTGRIQELLTEDGEIVWRGKQQLWGREESANDDNRSCRLRFPGQYEDTESGLYYNRFRYYDCETGQYLCADPIGLAGGANPYGYVHNPLLWIDPLGLKPPKIRGTQIGFKDPDYIDIVKNKMFNNDFDFSLLENKIGGYFDCKGVYHVGDGHHRMAAAIELYKETGSENYILNLLEHGKWDKGKPGNSRSMPSRSWWGNLKNVYLG